MQELVHGEVRVPEIELDLLEKCHVGGRGQLGVQPGGVPGGRTVARTWRQTQDRRDAAPQDVERCVERKMGKGGGEERGDRFIYVYLRLSWEAGAVYLFMAWGPGRRSANRGWPGPRTRRFPVEAPSETDTASPESLAAPVA